MQTNDNIKLLQPHWHDDTQQIDVDYYEKKFKRTLEEWNQFIRGEMKIDISVVPGEILESWARCKTMGVNPLDSPKINILSENDLQTLLQKNMKLISASRPFMNQLYHLVKSSRFNVSLFDKDGVILEVMQDKQYEETSLASVWLVGTQWSENIAGNNAAGTAIFYKKPIRIFGSQHYCHAYHKYAVSSAPIFSPEGELIGGITIIGYHFGAHPHTLGIAVAAAQAIENELRSQKTLDAVNKTSNDQKTVISNIPEAIITIDSQDYISFMNDHAKKMFHVSTHSIEGMRLKDVLGAINNNFLEIIEHNESITDMELRIFTRNGSNDFTLTCNPIISPDGSFTGKIIFLSGIKRARTLVTRMIGAKAKFHFEDIDGQHPAFLKTLEQARMISQRTSTVLLLGKSGTGKDLFAQAIHNASPRKDGPYIAVNCAAIPRDLITSEFFGYSEGAFTGSRKGGNQGKFELADGGTIFLDEIAEMPLELQSVLLRVIEEKSVTRIGGTRIRPVDVRIIAATNKDLKEEIRKGAFRKDLYYRLNVFSIHLIPLNERPDDILLLMNLFVRKYENSLNKRINHIHPDVITTFLNYPWPGNIRELQNIIERMMNIVRSNELTPDLIPEEIINFSKISPADALIESPEETERKTIMKLLHLKFPKNVIAKKMNISRMTLYRKMGKYGLK
jgi:sigma-54 dependent transcriptional regulator, acetoin dehydrogenase operon transcriptional activator AcoR